jgi:hypothetical protein
MVMILQYQVQELQQKHLLVVEVVEIMLVQVQTNLMVRQEVQVVAEEMQMLIQHLD